MNQSTKQRVVGTVVLLALALIFLPIIFDGEGSYQRPLSSRIPAPPVVDIMSDPIPQRPVIQADSITTVTTQPVSDVTGPILDAIDDGNTQDEVVAQIDVTPPETEVEAPAQLPGTSTPGLDESGLPAGWSVRLGSFSNATNAQNLTRRLLAAGYRAYSRQLSTDRGPLTAVFVGPQVERDKADQLKQQLQSEFDLAGIVVRFEVDSF